MRHARVAALCLLAAACGSKNEVGFWDLRSLTITAAGETQEQVDFGTLEMTESGAIHAVYRYDVLDPALVAAGAADTGDAGTGEAGDWMPPLPRPVRTTGDFDDYDHYISTLAIGNMTLRNIEMTRYKGTEITYASTEGSEVRLGTTLVDSVVLELTR